MPKKNDKKSTKPRSSNTKRKSASRPQASDQPLRDHVLFLLQGGGAHIGFKDAFVDWPLQSLGAKVAKFPHTAWMLFEHMRLAQWDILEFSRNPKHVSPPWPEGYWPKSAAPPNEKAWAASVAAFNKDLRTMEQLVSDKKIDLFKPIPWGDGQTLLREALLVADHNAYHLGQLITLRKSLGV